jgi:hypothetical protein
METSGMMTTERLLHRRGLLLGGGSIPVEWQPSSIGREVSCRGGFRVNWAVTCTCAAIKIVVLSRAFGKMGVACCLLYTCA